jgi:two-component system, OmpR family, KDP operon response regulator KdpE
MLLPDMLTTGHAHEARVLVIDDEYEIGQVLQLGLARAHFTVAWAATGQEGMDLAMRWHPDLILLDLALPDIDGLTLCRQIRAWSTTPILILSVRSATQDIVTALEIGADDYVTKPFHLDELIARIRVALRHASHPSGDQSEHIAIGDLVMDLAKRQVTIRGQAVHLSPTEFDVMAMLVRYAGRVVTHQALLSAVWGPQYTDAVHLLRLCMASLRRKIESNPSQPRLLLTEPGIGYRFDITL